MNTRKPPMLPDEVRESVDAVRVALNDWTATYASEFCDESTVEAARKRISERGTLAYICDALSAIESIRAHLLARDAEVERLQAIERERWDVVATRNAAVMRAERAEALLRDIADCAWFEREAPATVELITAHLSENSRG